MIAQADNPPMQASLAWWWVPINPIQTSGLNGINSHYNSTSTTITVDVTDESAVTPTVIVALSAHNLLSPALIDSDSKQSLQEEEERPERPRLKIIPAPKAENKKKWHKFVAYKDFSE